MERIIGNSSAICSLEALVTAGVVKALKSRPLTGQWEVPSPAMGQKEEKHWLEGTGIVEDHSLFNPRN